LAAARESVRQVLLRISGGAAIDELVDFFRARECSVRRVADDTIEVQAPATLAAGRAQMELDLLLRVWQQIHPGVKLQEIRR
jgi:hypothetical protein